MEENIISDRIRKEYEEGATQTELAKKYNIAQSYICRLIAGNSDDMNMKLSVIKKMFPKATISLDGTDFDIKIIENHKAIVDNIRKIVNDPNFTEEKKIAIIKAFLLD